ncbi:MAG: radical SAM protein, partial [Chitinophagia bacterium]|nr:radical SAM protein [Chitinophagia bacterium]
ETLELVKEAAQQGAKEIVLTGVNLGDFGIEHNQNFFDLVKAIDEVEGVDRYRISSIEPNLLTDEIIEFVAQSKRFVPHFHIPLQSGSDEILVRMRRKYLSDLYQSRIRKIKSLMPHCGIGVDVIVGFPGETEENFLETYRFLNELDVSYLHVFPYSERANTTAKKMKEVVPLKVRMERGEMLRGLSEKKRMAFYREHLGTRRPVLFEEEERRGVMFGFTDNYIKVATDYDPLLVNTVAEVTLSSLDSEGWVNAAFDYAEVAHFNDCFGRRYAALFFVGQPSPPERKRHRQKPKQPTSFGRKNMILGRKTISGFHHQIEDFVSKDKCHQRIQCIFIASHAYSGNLFYFYFGELTQSGSSIELGRHRPEGSADTHGHKKAKGVHHF